jgi:hypothetical protein
MPLLSPPAFPAEPKGKADLIFPDLDCHDSYLVPNENLIVFLQGQN